MKPRYTIFPLLAGAVSLVSCDQKAPEAKKEDKGVIEKVAEKLEDVEVPDAVKQKVAESAPLLNEKLEDAEEKVNAIVAPGKVGTLDELAAKTGFAKMLPKDVAAYSGFYNGAKTVERMRGSKLGKFTEKAMEEQGMDLDDLKNDPDFEQFASVAGEELFVAIGQGSSEQAANLMVLADKSNYYQFRFLVKMMGEMISGKSDIQGMEQYTYMLDLAKDKEAIKVFEKSAMPPVYLGFKVSDAEKRKSLVEQIQSLGDLMLNEQDVEVLKAIEAKVGDGFKGVQLDGKLVAKQITGDPEAEFKKMIGSDAVEAYKKAIAEKNVVMLAGSVGDYVVIFFGKDVADLKFAASVDESILARDDMSFAKDYSDKELVSLMFIEENLQKTFFGNGSMKQLAAGVKDGFKETEAFGDTRVLEVLLDDLAKRGEALMSTYEAKRFGGVAFIEDGFKFEAFGGSNAPAVDLKAPRHLAGLGNKDDVLFFANWVGDSAYSEKQLEYLDAMGSTAYQFAKHTSELDINDEDFKQFSEGFKMFDGQFRPELLELWGALRTDLNAGLASESAFVIDINGEMPTVPEVPKAVIDNGRIPRISYVSTVEDRAKLSGSWDRINKSAEKILVKVSEMTGNEIPMQRPFKNSNDGLASYTFPIPMTHQNATPTVVVSDELFFVSTSPDFATALAGRYDAASKAEAGATMIFDFDALGTWSKGWVELLDKNEGKFLGAEEKAEYDEVRPMIGEFLEALKELDHLKVDTREEAGELRSSLHLKVR